jgi:hypothetical protein
MLALWILPTLPPNPGSPVDVAPYGTPLPQNNGVVWEDPREIHRVVVGFNGPPPQTNRLRLEYWSSRWPKQRLPKDREPGGGDVGWWELGNWYTGRWCVADTQIQTSGSEVSFTFRPVDEREHPEVRGFPARYRYTLKLRVMAEEQLPPIERIQAFTDSRWAKRVVRVEWQDTPRAEPTFTAFNGQVEQVERLAPNQYRLHIWVTENPDPNTFDRTLVSAQWGQEGFTFRSDDLQAGPLLLPHLHVAVFAGNDSRDYRALLQEQKVHGRKTLYARVKELPEQTWRSAWAGMPPKRSWIYFPLGLDGGRQRFRLNADGSILLRTNDHFLRNRPGKDTPRLEWERDPVHFRFGLPDNPIDRTIEEASLPICHTTWEVDGVQVLQTAFVTVLEGLGNDAPPPPGDATAVLLARFVFLNKDDMLHNAIFKLARETGGIPASLQMDADGILRDGARIRGQVMAMGKAEVDGKSLQWCWSLAPGETCAVTVKLPYILLEGAGEQAALARLDFEKERIAVASYWRRRLDQSAYLITPEPMLNEFYRAHAAHLLINCEREPGSERRFARVGSFSYGAFGNESCMMVVDLDRRGYHQEARACLDAWLHYQGTVPLPGDFDTQEGVLYGAGGYEAGGYNQHHGWILWCLAEHYRFTRDMEWLCKAASGILAGAKWIIRERARTADRNDLSHGLLPAGSLEDIQDWWPWLSTNCYTWRGLAAAAWALEQIQHPEAARLRTEANDYHRALLAAFRAAAMRSPVVTLRDGTSVPHFPSHPFRRGRCFGWICETLEGALHLLITRALDPHSEEATWILNDYEDNLFLSNQYGYTLEDFERHWFGRGGMSMQACLLLDVEPYLYRDDVKNALRALFNAVAVGYFPDVRMLTEHALPHMGDWRGDHYKSSDESNAAGWLRYLFVREEGNTLLLGQAIPRDWLRPGARCGIEQAATYFGPTSVVYEAAENHIIAFVNGPRRNPPQEIQLRFREPSERSLEHVTVNGKPWNKIAGEWVRLPGNIGQATIEATWQRK